MSVITFGWCHLTQNASHKSTAMGKSYCKRTDNWGWLCNSVIHSLMQCKSYPPACTYYCDLDPISTRKMVVTNPNSLLGYFPFDAWQGRRKKRSISLVERESSIDNEKGILHPSLQSLVARFLHSFPKPPTLQCFFVSTSSYFPSSNPISHPSIPKKILLPLTYNTFLRT